jgi:hypothetical protein
VNTINRHSIGLFILALLLLGAGHTNGYGQTKYEREFRLREQEVPASAKKYIQQLESGARIKWYFEDDALDDAIEAKFKWQGQRYSIEFDTLGELEDIEIQCRFRELPHQVQEAIEKDLEEIYNSHRVRKVQIQYLGEPEDLLALIRDGNQSAPHTTNYELIVKGKSPGGIHLYEVTFDHTGTKTKMARIVLRNIDNLEY